jgi:hypothetical protein
VRDDRPLIQTRDDLLELIAHALRLQLSYLSKDQALAVADTILRTLKAARYRSGAYTGGIRSGVMEIRQHTLAGAPVPVPPCSTAGPLRRVGPDSHFNGANC